MISSLRSNIWFLRRGGPAAGGVRLGRRLDGRRRLLRLLLLRLEVEGVGGRHEHGDEAGDVLPVERLGEKDEGEGGWRLQARGCRLQATKAIQYAIGYMAIMTLWLLDSRL